MGHIGGGGGGGGVGPKFLRKARFVNAIYVYNA